MTPGGAISLGDSCQGGWALHTAPNAPTHEECCGRKANMVPLAQLCFEGAHRAKDPRCLRYFHSK